MELYWWRFAPRYGICQVGRGILSGLYKCYIIITNPNCIKITFEKLYKKFGLVNFERNVINIYSKSLNYKTMYHVLWSIIVQDIAPDSVLPAKESLITRISTVQHLLPPVPSGFLLMNPLSVGRSSFAWDDAYMPCFNMLTYIWEKISTSMCTTIKI